MAKREDEAEKPPTLREALVEDIMDKSPMPSTTSWIRIQWKGVKEGKLLFGLIAFLLLAALTWVLWNLVIAPKSEEISQLNEKISDLELELAPFRAAQLRLKLDSDEEKADRIMSALELQSMLLSNLPPGSRIDELLTHTSNLVQRASSRTHLGLSVNGVVVSNRPAYHSIEGFPPLSLNAINLGKETAKSLTVRVNTSTQSEFVIADHWTVVGNTHPSKGIWGTNTVSPMWSTMAAGLILPGDHFSPPPISISTNAPPPIVLDILVYAEATDVQRFRLVLK